MENNNKIKLDDSVFDDIETDNSFKKQKNNKKNMLEDDLSMDDLFDFKPRGTVGDEDDFMKSFMNNDNDSFEAKFTKKKPVTKKEKLASILDEPLGLDDEPQFLKENDEKQETQQKQEIKTKSELRDSLLKDNVVVYEGNNKQKQENELSISDKKAKSLIESALYISGNDGVSLNDLKRLTGLATGDIKSILKKITNEWDNDDSRGMTIKIFGERYKIMTKVENREDLSRLVTIKYRNPLSSKIMETLAIIAYNQPCTRTIIEDIRAKDPTSSIQKLIELGLVEEAGRADTPGRPLLYNVTHKFYDIFGIKNLSELPKINISQPFEDSDISFFDTTRFND